MVHYAIPFDATWSDAEAMAAGWVEGEFGPAPWANTVANVGTQIQASGFKIQSARFSTHVGIDNFTPGADIIVVPEPAAIALIGLGGTAMLIRRRRN